jgi:sulfonate transport system permease protein
VPTLGLIPLLILWLGIGEGFKVTVIATSVAVPVYINTHAALSGIDQKLVELAETVNLSRWRFIRSIVFPGSLPGFFVGLRLAVTMSWTALVVVEQVNAISGIGYMMQRAQEYGQTAVVVVGLVFYAIFGFVSDACVRMLERRVLRWRRTMAA